MRVASITAVVVCCSSHSRTIRWFVPVRSASSSIVAGPSGRAIRANPAGSRSRGRPRRTLHRSRRGDARRTGNACRPGPSLSWMQVPEPIRPLGPRLHSTFTGCPPRQALANQPPVLRSVRVLAGALHNRPSQHADERQEDRQDRGDSRRRWLYLAGRSGGAFRRRRPRHQPYPGRQKS